MSRALRQSVTDTATSNTHLVSGLNIDLGCSNSVQQSSIHHQNQGHQQPTAQMSAQWSPETARLSPASKRLAVFTPSYTPAEHSVKEKAVVSRGSTDSIAVTTSPVDEQKFFQASLDRYLDFSHHESCAESEEEKLRLFAQYMVRESTFRRARYATAFDRVVMDVFELTHDMWRPLDDTTREGESTGDRNASRSSADPSTGDCSLASAVPSSQASIIDPSPASDVASYQDDDEQWEEEADFEDIRHDKFQPTLSPIPSMAVSTVPEENSSRGRPASRWWEASDTGSSGQGGRKLERSERESKYMSLRPDTLRIEAQPSPSLSTPTPNASTFPRHSSGYPPEKTQFDQDLGGALVQDRLNPTTSPSSSMVERTRQPMVRKECTSLDISRLITLPPPYPRHYPAVNNNHPVLEEQRKIQRELADLSYVRSLKSDYRTAVMAFEAADTERREAFESQIQTQLRNGLISDSSYSQAYDRFEHDESKRTTARIQDAPYRYDLTVAEPGINYLNSRIDKADSSIATMFLTLTQSSQSGHSERAQISGDEEPELLEQLTLLKWLFETREQLHNELFEMKLHQHHLRTLTRPTPSTTLSQENNTIHTLRLSHLTTSQTRFASLHSAITPHITTGVETQLSAFWDIAPQLLSLVSAIPLDATALAGFSIVVPASELVENESYGDYPLLYLHAMLCHARSAVYQFVEAQVSLLCLGHEVATAAMRAEARRREVELSLIHI